jgi:hypothetical protein
MTQPLWNPSSDRPLRVQRLSDYRGRTYRPEQDPPPEIEPVVLYGLLTAGDVAELDRRRELAAAQGWRPRH